MAWLLPTMPIATMNEDANARCVLLVLVLLLFLLGMGKITKWKWANYKKIIIVTAYVIPTRIKCTMSHVS